MRALKFKDGTYQTEHGTINPQTWEGIEVIRGRQIDSDNVAIEVVLNEKEAIASGHYNIRTNWVSYHYGKRVVRRYGRYFKR